MSDILLFSQYSWLNFFNNNFTKAKKLVHEIPKDQFRSNTDEQVIAHVYSKTELIPITIYRDKAVLSDPIETNIKDKNMFDQLITKDLVEIALSIPYSGDSKLWVVMPNRYDHNPPQGTISPERGDKQVGTLKVKMLFPQNKFQPEVVNQEIEKYFYSLERYVSWINNDVEKHNEQLKFEITKQVKERREKLGEIQKTIELLNIPIVKRDDAPDITELPIQRKVIEPLPSKRQSSPEYGISESTYDHILNVIHHEGISFERTPVTFAVHDEEELRDILLAHLNSHFKGQATGETFRKKGKTDICIEFENRAAFVAECKLWKGRKGLHETVDQLLGYLTWRDVKAALVLFNKDVAGFKQIQEKVLEILKEHPNCINAELLPENSEWRIVLRSKEDPERFITVRVFLFNLFTS